MSFVSDWIGRALRRELRRFDAERGISAALREQVRIALAATPRFQDSRRLLRYEHQVFSQGGEDGAIREIFRRIGEGDRRFVEYGVGDGLENNTAFLLQQGWSGVWIEGDERNGEKIRSKFGPHLTSGQLACVTARIDVRNAVAVLPQWAREEAFDLLSVDLDRNTFSIWQALAPIRPRVIVVEYNAVWPADMEFAVRYAAEKSWNGSSHFGASLKTLELYGRKTGYALVGCDSAGTNAYFVRSDQLSDRFCDPYSAENHYEPIRYFLHVKEGHARDVEG
jgi:hypothetical protein